jgi:tRNA modification GTPase
MVADIRETIVALSSAPGSGGRAIVRLTGPAALTCAENFFRSKSAIIKSRRLSCSGQIQLPQIYSPLPAQLHFWPAPRTYTGQELVELHTISCPPLIDVLIAQLLNSGARAARPGEFTLRAFLAGKLDLTQAEAVLGIIEATSRAELGQALRQLAGGIAVPLQGLRSDLLDLLADIEAGLDFSEEDIQFVARQNLLERLSAGATQLQLLARQVEDRGVCADIFQAVLVGRPSAGKSSLFNALAGNAAALVSPEPGTTRDYLVQRLDLDGIAVELIDSAGWRGPAELPPQENEEEGSEPAVTINVQAELLGREQAVLADLILLCVEAGQAPNEQEQQLALGNDQRRVVRVATKCDLHPSQPGWVATSAVTGYGLDALREVLAQHAVARRQPPLAPSLSRCQHHVHAALDHLEHARELASNDEPAELLAVELRGGLDELGAMVGAVYTDDLLDRIFSRFCIGK